LSQSLIPFDHLERLTDDTGLLEHCLGRIPRRREGYSTDDNARAIWVCMEWLQQLPSEEAQTRRRLYRLLDRYLAFLLWAQQEDGWFQNNIHFDRTPEPETRSHDCLGRSLWGAAVVYVHLDDDARRRVAAEILRKALPASPQLANTRGVAWALATCCLLLQAEKGTSLLDSELVERPEKAGHAQEAARARRRDSSHAESVLDPLGLTVETLTEYADTFERRLLDAYRAESDANWRWFDPEMTYSNGLLPWALWVAYRTRGRTETLEVAKESLDFLLTKMSGKNGVIRPIGNRGWCTREWRADWDQQPVDAMKLALAAREAYWAVGDERYRDVVRRCRAWFYGENDLGLPLADPSDGSCCDGLNANGPNPNRGAESTLSYLLTEAFAHSLQLEGIHDEHLVYAGGSTAAGV
jgi:hypothetical protein